MCGIYGIAGPRRHSDDVAIERMDGVLFHRGPDAGGFHRGAFAAMGMRRLSIVDLAGGAQPIWNAACNAWIVFNGEIYNYPELRKELETRGYVFRTHSDTEVIIAGYDAWGDDVVLHLSGMFAFAISDEVRGRVFFARDHIGKKPLYFWNSGGRVVFGSEPKAILAHPDFIRRVCPEAVSHYLSLKHIPAPLCMFQGINALRPGCRAIWHAGELREEQYYRPSFIGTTNLDERQAAEHLALLLAAAVERRMRLADVPVGSYLSGGLDSSLVSILAARSTAGPLQTFSLGYAEDFAGKSDDVASARIVAKHIGSDHHELTLDAEDVLRDTEAVLGAFDEPFAGVSSTFFLSALIRKHVKVAVAGDGADELFGSYAAHRMAAVLAARRAGGTELGSFAARPDLVADCSAEPAEGWRLRFAGFTDREKTRVVADPAFRSSTEAYLAPFFDDAHGDLVNQILEVDTRTLLPDQVLSFVDRLSMAHSVEVRGPFLDRSVIDFAASLPGSYKVRVDATKSVLKRAARGIVPDSIIDRRKEGFVLPLDRWLRTRLAGFVREITSAQWNSHGIFDSTEVRSMVEEHHAGHADHTHRIWTIAMFQLWHARYIENRSTAGVETLLAAT
ncbi:MAG: asparagine synthase (glutamine-hydrolyzing) [Candidatus Velthaea sp.]